MNLQPELHSQSLLKAVLGSLREGIIVIDYNTHVVLYNQAAAGIFQFRPYLNASSSSPLRLIDVTRNKVIHEGFSHVLKTGIGFNGEVEFLGGRDYVFSFRVTPLKISIDNSIDGAIGVFFDITQLMNLERIRREFFSNLSHELRTPLTAISVYVETLLNGAINDLENNIHFLEIIDKHANRMRNLVEDISDLSAIEAGEIILNFKNINLKTFVDNLKPLIKSDLENKKISFINKISTETIIYADPKSLEQTLMNLFINAIKFNVQNGSVTIDSSAKENDLIEIKIQDTGIGIDEHDLPRIFERLYRVDKSRSQDVGGTGLGLAIVKHLVMANNGEISAKSTPNVGSEFSIRLPKGI